ncbi:MAG: hypothetical protein ABI840_13065, partial [bacterium]
MINSINSEYLEDITKVFYSTMDLHNKVTNVMTGTLPSKKKYWMPRVQYFSAKLVNHLFTLIYIIEGTPEKFISKGLEFKVIDRSSINIILRAAFETYL